MTQDLGGYPVGEKDLSPIDERGQSDPQSSAAGVAREQAAQVGQSVRDAGGQVAGTAVDRAKDVVSEAQWQAHDLLGQAQEQARDQAQAQQQKAAGWLHGFADELSAMAHNGGQGGAATELARQASGRLRDAASWLEQHEPADLVEEVRRFARRRPGVFVLVAATAGIAAGRLTRGAVAAQKDSAPETPSADTDGWVSQAADEPVTSAPADDITWAPAGPSFGGVQS